VVRERRVAALVLAAVVCSSVSATAGLDERFRFARALDSRGGPAIHTAFVHGDSERGHPAAAGADVGNNRSPTGFRRRTVWSATASRAGHGGPADFRRWARDKSAQREPTPHGRHQLLLESESAGGLLDLPRSKAG